MPTRAPPPHEDVNAPDKSQVCSNMKEPFMVTVRELNSFNVKTIFWYVAALEEGGRDRKGEGEPAFKAEFWRLPEALEKLTFQTDREVLRNAIKLVQATPGI